MLGVSLLGVVKGGITARTRMVLFATGSWSHILEQRLAVAVGLVGFTSAAMGKTNNAQAFT